MHLAEGVLPLSQAIAWSTLAAPTVYWSLHRERRTRRNTPSSSVIMAGVTSLLFAGTLLPLPVLVVRLLSIRRPDLLPNSLRRLRTVSAPVASAMLPLLVIGLPGCAYEGIDGSVFGATAEGAGRAPTGSILDLSQGEIGLAMSILILFGMGFIAGRSWERVLGGGRDAPPR